MTRFLVIVVLVALAIWLLRRALRGPRVGAAEAPSAPAGEAAGELVRCARCGVHLPRAEARMQGERLYCSEEHARLGPERG